MMRVADRGGAFFAPSDCAGVIVLCRISAQLGQADFQVPDQPDFDGIVLADLPRVLIDMHDFYMFGNCRDGSK